MLKANVLLGKRQTESNLGRLLMSMPLPFFAVIITLFNDFVLKKTICAGLVTGKISDVFGIFFSPFFITDICILVVGLFSKKKLSEFFRSCIFGGALLFIGIGFIFLKTSVLFNQLFLSFYRDILGHRAHAMMDLTDLWALISLFFAWVYYSEKKNRSDRFIRFSAKLAAITIGFSSSFATAGAKQKSIANNLDEVQKQDLSFYVGIPFESRNYFYNKLKDTYIHSGTESGYAVSMRYSFLYKNWALRPSFGITHSEMKIKQSYGTSKIEIVNNSWVLDGSLKAYLKKRWDFDLFIQMGINYSLSDKVELTSATGSSTFLGDDHNLLIIPFRGEFGLEYPVTQDVTIDALLSGSLSRSPLIIFIGGSYGF